eukprot:Pgem_evm10s4769
MDLHYFVYKKVIRCLIDDTNSLLNLFQIGNKQYHEYFNKYAEDVVIDEFQWAFEDRKDKCYYCQQKYTKRKLSTQRINISLIVRQFFPHVSLPDFVIQHGYVCYRCLLTNERLERIRLLCKVVMETFALINKSCNETEVIKTTVLKMLHEDFISNIPMKVRTLGRYKVMHLYKLNHVMVLYGLLDPEKNMRRIIPIMTSIAREQNYKDNWSIFCLINDKTNEWKEEDKTKNIEKRQKQFVEYFMPIILKITNREQFVSDIHQTYVSKNLITKVDDDIFNKNNLLKCFINNPKEYLNSEFNVCNKGDSLKKQVGSIIEKYYRNILQAQKNKARKAELLAALAHHGIYEVRQDSKLMSAFLNTGRGIGEYQTCQQISLRMAQCKYLFEYCNLKKKIDVCIRNCKEWYGEFEYQECREMCENNCTFPATWPWMQASN